MFDRLFWPLVALIVGLLLVGIPPLARQPGVNRFGWICVAGGVLVALLVVSRVAIGSR